MLFKYILGYQDTGFYVAQDASQYSDLTNI
jgi:hypothetical protein